MPRLWTELRAHVPKHPHLFSVDLDVILKMDVLSSYYGVK
jgi:hypothetical protein